MANLSTVFVDDSTVALRLVEVPDAVWNSGMFGGNNAPGVGIGTDNPNLEESLPNWTLLDQFGNARVGQRGQNIGGSGYTVAAEYPSSGGEEGTLPDSTIRTQNVNDLDGTGTLSIDPAPNAELETLEEGWRAQVI
jgi:hypothetical protein